MDDLIDYHLITLSNGDTLVAADVPGVMSLGIAPEDVHEVSRQKLPAMTKEEAKALMSQAATHRLRLDKASGKVMAELKKAAVDPTPSPDSMAH